MRSVGHCEYKRRNELRAYKPDYCERVVVNVNKVLVFASFLLLMSCFLFYNHFTCSPFICQTKLGV